MEKFDIYHQEVSRARRLAGRKIDIQLEAEIAADLDARMPKLTEDAIRDVFTEARTKVDVPSLADLTAAWHRICERNRNTPQRNALPAPDPTTAAPNSDDCWRDLAARRIASRQPSVKALFPPPSDWMVRMLGSVPSAKEIHAFCKMVMERREQRWLLEYWGGNNPYGLSEGQIQASVRMVAQPELREILE